MASERETIIALVKQSVFILKDMAAAVREIENHFVGPPTKLTTLTKRIESRVGDYERLAAQLLAR